MMARVRVAICPRPALRLECLTSVESLTWFELADAFVRRRFTKRPSASRGGESEFAVIVMNPLDGLRASYPERESATGTHPQRSKLGPVSATNHREPSGCALQGRRRKL